MSVNSRRLWASIAVSIALSSSSLALAMPSSEKTCKPFSVSTPGTSIVESVAKSRALNAWVGYVTNHHGSSWAIWNNAMQKRFNCIGNGPPKVTCYASGRPCRVKALIHGDQPAPHFDPPHVHFPPRPGRRPLHFRIPNHRAEIPLRRMPRLRLRRMPRLR